MWRSGRATAHRTVYAGVALCVFGTSASAQAPCERFPHTTDSVRVLIQAVLRTSDTTKLISALDADEILRAVAAGISLSPNLALPVFPGSSDRAIKENGVNFAWPQFTGRVRFKLEAGGRITGISPMIRSMTPGLDRMLIQAVEKAHSSGVLASMIVPRDGYSLEFQIVAKERADSLSLTLHRATFAAYRVEHLVLPLKDTPKPKYPEKARRLNAEGSATFTFVVGEDGAIVPGTAVLTRATYAELVQAAIDFLPKIRFVPAVAAGCPINTWAVQQFDFKLAPLY